MYARLLYVNISATILSARNIDSQ